ncbi:MAG: NADH-quinone oxidoreductase subunit J [Thermoproteota archaeon]|nr:NADH-quinone oxidoreductase subunit J [Thermoproteota archaeon]
MGLVVSAFLAVYLDNAVYSVVSLASALILVAILYSLDDAIFVAVFQLAIGVGTLAVFFLSSEMLSEKLCERKSLKNAFLAIAVAVLLSIPSVFFSIGTIPTNVSSEVSFPEALWNLRAIDVVLQGLVMMTVALGIAVVLYEKKEGKS